jgi:hypothetical protein
MPNAPKNLCRTQIGAATTTLYSAPASTTTIITHIAICNTTTGAVTFSLANVVNGGAEADNNRFMKDAQVNAKSTIYVDLAMVLAAGDSLRGTASAASALTIIASGVEVT